MHHLIFIHSFYLTQAALPKKEHKT